MLGHFPQHDLGAFGERETGNPGAHGGNAMERSFHSEAMRKECAVEVRNARAVVCPPSCMLAA